MFRRGLSLSNFLTKSNYSGLEFMIGLAKGLSKNQYPIKTNKQEGHELTNTVLKT